jgi:hypothetical protein
MARVTEQEKPRIRQSGIIRVPAAASAYTPEPGEEPFAIAERGRYEREAAALKVYWAELVREMRKVDNRLEELDALLN